MIKQTLAAAVTAAVLLGPVAASAGTAVTLEARAGYFFPSSADFREVYKDGPAFGAEVTFSLGKIVGLWAGLDSFKKTGELTYTLEPTTMHIMPLFAGLKLQPASGSLRPYAAAAAGYFLFKESNVLGTASGQELGLLAQAGLLIKIKGRASFDVSVRYTSCKHGVTDPEPLSVQIGGLQAGIGIAFHL
jgi:opacity protein-like surface antigen